MELPWWKGRGVRGSITQRQSIGVFTRCGFVFGAFAVVVQEFAR